MSSPAGYDGIAVAAPVSFGYTLSPGHETPWFFTGALAALLRRAGIGKEAVDGLVAASYTLAPDHAAALASWLGMRPRFVADLPYGGASGVIALRRAARAVQAGDADVVACIAADVAPRGDGISSNFSRFSRDHVYPYGAGGANSVFALITQHYMRQHGVTREDFGQLCIALRANGLGTPLSLYQDPLTMQAYLAARPVAQPLHLFDCVRRCSGAEAFLVMTQDRARRLGLPHATVAACIERHNGDAAQPIQSGPLHPDAAALYEQAGLGPHEVDFVQAYDDYPVIVAMQLEALGFCAPGEGARYAARVNLAVDGELPLNTQGGMLGIGQAGAAGGFCGLTEALRQLTGQPLGRAVPHARVGVVSGYGTVSYDRGLCTAAAILRAGDRA